MAAKKRKLGADNIHKIIELEIPFEKVSQCLFKYVWVFWWYGLITMEIMRYYPIIYRVCVKTI